MKKVLCMLLSAMLMVTALTGCGGNSSSDSSTPAASGSDSSSGELTYEEFTGENVFDAVEWAQKNFPDATPIRYANNTSTAAYQSNGGAIGNMVCVNNVVQVCGTTGCAGKEGKLISRTIIPAVVYCLIIVAVMSIAVFVMGYDPYPLR